MANVQIGPVNVRFKNSLKAGALPDGSNGLTTPLNYTSLNAMRSALTTANAAYYTAAKLDQMCVNDMVFALRNMQDATTIASYMTNSAA